MLTDLGDVVELVAWNIIAEPVAGVLGEPVIAGPRIDVAADAIAYPECDGLGETGLGINVTNLRNRGRREADVAGRSERNVEPAVLVEG